MTPEIRFALYVLAFLYFCVVLGSLAACGSGEVDYLPKANVVSKPECVTDMECELADRAAGIVRKEQ